ncbi:MAG: hypothetical protein C0478_17345, partial [Planctomyces sp.]|nr:hypothetical protein [Planctomyces sp.]
DPLHEPPATLPHPSLHETPPLLTPAQQYEFLELLTKGASIFGACEEIGCTQLQYTLTRDHDANFADMLKAIRETQGENVAARLYQTALQGNVTAQQFWLRHQPPAEWREAPTRPEGSDLSDEDLLDRCREAGLDLPPRFAARLGTPGLPQ